MDIDPLIPGDKNHFSVYANADCILRIAFVRNPETDTWLYGPLIPGGQLIGPLPPATGFPSSYAAYENARQYYPEMMEWKMLKRLGKV